MRAQLGGFIAGSCRLPIFSSVPACDAGKQMQEESMSSAMRATKGGRRIARALVAVALTLGVGLALAAPAHADDDWNGGWNHGKHHKHWKGGYGYGGYPGYWAPRPRVYYAPPPVYYAPPPVYYAPPPVYYAPPPVYYGPPSLSVVIPFKF
jgi:hypothetical protein